MLNASFDHIEALIKCNANSLGEQTGSKHTNLRLLFQKSNATFFKCSTDVHSMQHKECFKSDK